MESKVLETAPASAPSYEEAMKCSSVSPAQMSPYPTHMLSNESAGIMVQPNQPQTVMQPSHAMPPVQQTQPMVQSKFIQINLSLIFFYQISAMNEFC